MYVIPQFESLFQTFHTSLPLLTRLIITFSHGAYQLLPLIIALLALLNLIMLYAYRNQKKFKTVLDTACLKSPWMGLVLTLAFETLFIRSLSILLSAGIPLTRSLELLKLISRNEFHQQKINHLESLLLQGYSFYEALKRSKLISLEKLYMIHLGESSGKLPSMLIKISDLCEEQLQEKIQSFLTWLEPTLMISLGIIVGLLVIALYLPMFNLGELF